MVFGTTPLLTIYFVKNRRIGVFGGQLPGPLVVVGGLHGNEPAGIYALEQIFQILEKESEANPEFIFRGTLLGLIGHVQANRLGKRFLQRDLNRHWTVANLQRSKHTPTEMLEDEDLEVAELLHSMRAQVRMSQPDTLVLLDLHTTSAEGGIFCIPMDEADSLTLARALYAPVVLGLHDGLEGTLLQAARNGVFKSEGWPKKVLGLAFESGQHEDPLSVSRAIAAIVHCLRAVGCVRPDDVESKHEAVLRDRTKHLPSVVRLQHIHRIQAGDGFRMRPGYVNFQSIHEKEHLADDSNGPILSPCDGVILMPLYQAQGSDGFFICA